MKIACAFDHAGFPLKAMVVETVAGAGHEVIDLGTWSTDPVDYPDTARMAAEAVRNGDADRAVLVCGSGAGVAVAACKFPGVRAVVAHDTYTAHQSVEHDDCNILCLGGRVIGRRWRPTSSAPTWRRSSPARTARAAAGEDRRDRTRVPARRHLGRVVGCGVVECDVCGETISAADDEELARRLRDHLTDEHDESPTTTRSSQTIDREAYDAMDS